MFVVVCVSTIVFRTEGAECVGAKDKNFPLSFDKKSWYYKNMKKGSGRD